MKIRFAAPVRSFSIIFGALLSHQISPMKPLKKCNLRSRKNWFGFLWSMKIEGIPDSIWFACMMRRPRAVRVFRCSESEILGIFNKKIFILFSVSFFCYCWWSMLGWIDVRWWSERKTRRPDEYENFSLMKLYPSHQWKITSREEESSRSESDTKASQSQKTSRI